MAYGKDTQTHTMIPLKKIPKLIECLGHNIKSSLIPQMFASSAQEVMTHVHDSKPPTALSREVLLQHFACISSVVFTTVWGGFCYSPSPSADEKSGACRGQVCPGSPARKRRAGSWAQAVW